MTICKKEGSKKDDEKKWTQMDELPDSTVVLTFSSLSFCMIEKRQFAS
jgi:hypothetical protein